MAPSQGRAATAAGVAPIAGRANSKPWHTEQMILVAHAGGACSQLFVGEHHLSWAVSNKDHLLCVPWLAVGACLQALLWEQHQQLLQLYLVTVPFLGALILAVVLLLQSVN